MKEYESTIVKIVEKSKFQEVLLCKNARNFDVLQTNRSTQIRNSIIDNQLEGGCALLDHRSYGTIIRANNDMVPCAQKTLLAYIKADWKFLNDYITESSSKPYSYSNVGKQVRHCYNWVREIIDSPSVPKHRSNQTLG